MKFPQIANCFLLTLAVAGHVAANEPPAKKLPEPGSVVTDAERREVVLSAKVQFPEGKPCINEFGQRIQCSNFISSYPLFASLPLAPIKNPSQRRVFTPAHHKGHSQR